MVYLSGNKTALTVAAVCALQCEAKPFIEKYQLKKIVSESTAFSIYRDKNHSFYLIISGIGKINAASATTYLYSYIKQKNNLIFLNIGICGSNHFEMGSLVHINKIKDQSSSKKFYPYAQSFKKNSTQALCITVDTADQNYPDKAIVDMEASGFFQSAQRFVTVEYIYIVKVVSDTDELSKNKINADIVSHLIAKHVDYIDTFLAYLNQLLLNIQNDRVEHLVSQLANKFHFSHAQLIELKKYLVRLQIQIRHLNALEFCASEKNAADIIVKLKRNLEYANCIS